MLLPKKQRLTRRLDTRLKATLIEVLIYTVDERKRRKVVFFASEGSGRWSHPFDRLQLPGLAEVIPSASSGSGNELLLSQYPSDSKKLSLAEPRDALES